jgi:uncharacterized protein YdaU (DUF1376 family)
MNRKRFAPISRLAVLLTIMVGLGLAAANLQSLMDYARLYHYQPTADIVSLADQTTMTPQARRLFYINHPVLADRDSFNGACNSRGEQTIVLGCYRSRDHGIYLFRVTDTRLNGVEQLTAAHEMLHAAYDRLSKSERASINTELQNFYDQKVQDKRIRDTVAAYEKSEPNDIVNEMHSIFATEIGGLTPELENYYSRYFTNRQQVVAFANSYQVEFTSRQEKVAAYDARLRSLKAQIDSNSAALAKEEQQIGVQQRDLEQTRASGNVEAYNAKVPVFNARVDQYNALIRTTQNSIATYNKLVNERNEVALEVRGLTQSISSQFAPIE